MQIEMRTCAKGNRNILVLCTEKEDLRGRRMKPSGSGGGDYTHPIKPPLVQGLARVAVCRDCSPCARSGLVPFCSEGLEHTDRAEQGLHQSPCQEQGSSSQSCSRPPCFFGQQIGVLHIGGHRAVPAGTRT